MPRASITSRMALVGILGDGKAQDAAALLSITEAEFRAKLDDLIRIKFPRPNPVTGMIDLDAVVAWRKGLHPQVYGLTMAAPARDAAGLVHDRLRAAGTCRDAAADARGR